ncbi:MAG: divalent-cation tolerance protein CutA [Synechococcus sp.]
MSKFLQVCTTLATQEDAESLTTRLLESHLVACGQIVGPIISRYWWNGTLETATEWQCLVKTSQKLYPSLQALILNHHPYDTPEIVALPIVSGSHAYLSWVEQQLHLSETAEEVSTKIDEKKE